MTKAPVATPIAAVGDLVTYVDHHGRRQIGHVTYIEAKWSSYFGFKPLITYCVEHPSYRNRRHYTGTVSTILEEEPQP